MSSQNLRVETLVDAVPSKATILDLGCVQHDAEKESNNDWLHGRLVDMDADVLGVDYLAEEVEKLNAQGYNVEQADVEQMDLGRQFDVVVAGELIEHLSNIGDFLESVQNHLSADGQFILTTPNPWAFHRFKQALLQDDVNANPEHTCWLDERTIKQVFARHGFETSRVDYVRPSQGGITRFVYDLGFETLGGTSLLVVAKPA